MGVGRGGALRLGVYLYCSRMALRMAYRRILCNVYGHMNQIMG